MSPKSRAIPLLSDLSHLKKLVPRSQSDCSFGSWLPAGFVSFLPLALFGAVFALQIISKLCCKCCLFEDSQNYFFSLLSMHFQLPLCLRLSLVTIWIWSGSFQGIYLCFGSLLCRLQVIELFTNLDPERQPSELGSFALTDQHESAHFVSVSYLL